MHPPSHAAGPATALCVCMPNPTAHACALIACLCSLFMIPETKGVPLDQVGSSSTCICRLGASVPACHGSSVAAALQPPVTQPSDVRSRLSSQVQERLQTHWLWRHAMKELREAGEVAEAEAAAKTALAKLSGGGTEEKDAEVPAQAHGAPPA